MGASSVIGLTAKIHIWEHREKALIMNGKRSQQRLPRDGEAEVCPAVGVEVGQWELSGEVDLDGEMNCARLD